MENINYDANCGGYRVEEYEVGEGREGKRARGRVEHIGCYQSVAGTPGYPPRLVRGHRCPCFLECRYREGGGQRERRARRGLEEDLVLGGNRTVFVSVASSLADVLFSVSL